MGKVHRPAAATAAATYQLHNNHTSVMGGDWPGDSFANGIDLNVIIALPRAPIDSFFFASEVLSMASLLGATVSFQ